MNRTVIVPRGCDLRGAEHALQSRSGVRTFTQGEDQELQTWSSDVEVAIREAITPWPSGVEDSAVTAPFVRALEVEGPTTIFDRAGASGDFESPERVTARGSRIERAVTEDELDDSYEAALKKFV